MHSVGLISTLACLAAAIGARGEDESKTQRLLSDAAFRTQAQSAETHAGPSGFKISDDSGDYTLKIQGQMQVRYTANLRSNPPVGDEHLTLGFENRRTKLFFSGNAGSPDVTYKLVWAFSPSLMNMPILEDGYFDIRLDGDWSVRVGQFKLPVNRENTVSSKYQLAADRSASNIPFTPLWSLGSALTYADQDHRFVFAYSDGVRTLNTPFYSTTHADYAFTFRGEKKWGGTWRRFDDFTSFPDSDFAVMSGISVHQQEGGSKGGPTGDATGVPDTRILVADVTVEGDGWNAYTTAMMRRRDGVGVSDQEDYGFILQGGRFISENDELFGRYDVVFPDSGSFDAFNTLTFGWNRYIIPESHALKFTLDLQWFLDAQSDTGPPGALTVPLSRGIGLLGDTGSAQAAVRAQMQLLF